MKILNDIILKHMACSYVVYCTNDTSYLSFEEYCNRYSHTLKTQANLIADIIGSAKKQMKKEKKNGVK